MSALLNSCDDCAQLVMDECADITINAGLSPDTDYYWTITVTIGGIPLKWSHTDTTDANGELVILESYFPDGFLSKGIGQLSLVIKTSEDGDIVPVTFGYSEYDCLLLTFEKVQAVTEVDELVFGCTDPAATNYNPLATFEDGSCVFPGAVLGCIDPDANNYNALATQDDGSCEYDAVPGVPNYVDVICSEYDMQTIQYDAEGAAPVGLFADLYSETCNTNTNHPVVISLHPGGGSRTSFDAVKYAKGFASRGYLGISASYGETNPYTLAKQKQNIANVCALIRFLRANAVTYGIKPENIFVLGISAGALTALGTGIAANDLDADAAYFDNAINLTNPTESSKPLATATQSGAVINGIAAFINAGDVPNYFHHGTADLTMPYSQAIANYNAQIAAGIPSTFVPYPGEGHGVGSHYDEIMEGGDLLLDGVTVDIGIVQKFKNLLVP